MASRLADNTPASVPLLSQLFPPLRVKENGNLSRNFKMGKVTKMRRFEGKFRNRASSSLTNRKPLSINLLTRCTFAADIKPFKWEVILISRNFIDVSLAFPRVQLDTMFLNDASINRARRFSADSPIRRIGTGIE